MKIVVSTCDSYHYVLRVFCRLYEHFWGDPATIVGYKKPDFELPDCFEFVSMGKDRGTHHWADDLRGYFSSIEEDRFIWMMEDTFIYKPVDREAIKTLHSCAEGNVVRADLGDVLYKYLIVETKPWKTVDGVQLHYTDTGRKTNMPVSAWNKEMFLRYCRSGYTPWQFEKRGGAEAAKNPDHISVCANPDERLPVPYTEGMCRQTPNLFQMTHVPESLIKEFQEKGWIGGHKGTRIWGKREQQLYEAKR